MRLIGVTEPVGHVGPGSDSGSGQFGRSVNPVAIEDLLRADADMLGEQPLQGAYRHMVTGGQLRHARHRLGATHRRLDELGDRLSGRLLSGNEVLQELGDQREPSRISHLLIGGDRNDGVGQLPHVGPEQRLGRYDLVDERSHRAVDQRAESPRSEQHAERPA